MPSSRIQRQTGSITYLAKGWLNYAGLLFNVCFMKFEHYAINVADSVKVADWYIEHCGLTARVALTKAPFTRFLADDTGRVFIEIYSNPDAPMPDYGRMSHLQYHLAFAVEDVETEKTRLMHAGCTFVEELNPAVNSRLVMLRDPFGIALQLCQRAQPF